MTAIQQPTYTRTVRKSNPYCEHAMNRAPSNNISGPVVPTLVNGCPATKWKITPTNAEDNRVSEMPIRLSVLSEDNPPNVIEVDREAKYINRMAANDSKLKPSVISLLYCGYLRLISFIIPPKNLFDFSKGPTISFRPLRFLPSSSPSSPPAAVSNGFSSLAIESFFLASNAFSFLVRIHSLFAFISSNGNKSSRCQLPGGNTIESSKKSFIADSKSRRSSALYAILWKCGFDIRVAMERPTSR